MDNIKKAEKKVDEPEETEEDPEGTASDKEKDGDDKENVDEKKKEKSPEDEGMFASNKKEFERKQKEFEKKKKSKKDKREYDDRDGKNDKDYTPKPPKFNRKKFYGTAIIVTGAYVGTGRLYWNYGHKLPKSIQERINYRNVFQSVK